MKYYILALCAVLTFGCAPKEQPAEFEPTTQDIATALQMKMWKVKVPDDLPDSKHLVLLLNYDGEEKELAGLGEKAGITAKVIIWYPGEPEQANLSINWGDSTTFGTLKHTVFSKTRMYKNTTKVCTVGDTLIDSGGFEPQYKIYLGIADK